MTLKILLLWVLLAISGCNSTAPKQAEQTDILSALAQQPSIKEIPKLTKQAKAVTNTPKQVEKTAEKPITDLWQYIKSKLTFNTEPHPRLQKRIDWYLQQPHYLEVVNKRAAPYLYHIVRKVEHEGLPMELALLPFVESDFRLTARSTKDAVGVWQLMDDTAYYFGAKRDQWYDGRQDVLASTDAALRYLSYLYKRFNGDWLHAIAAYNSGEGRVKKAIKHNQRRGKSTHFWHLSLPKETADYVPKLLALSALIKSENDTNFKIPKLARQPKTAVLDVGQQFDFAVLAKMISVNEKDLYQLNKGFLLHQSSPKGPHKLLLPLSEKTLLSSDFYRRFFSQKYTVKANDTLYAIARKFNSKVTTIKQLNDKTSDLIRVGETLLVTQNKASLQLLDEYQISPYLARPELPVEATIEKRHTIQLGDSLWTISKQYNVKVKDLLDWNNLTAQAILKPGKQLVMHLTPAPEPTETSSTTHTADSYDLRNIINAAGAQQGGP
ncbi:LysM peptidoglycan-binding domain-containing protein [Pseudoalteromonas sp. T1lg65]|uniref:LysM peptidoglycan-binding domain-containing protein n=1 Tax=Pseudoalteromonas sp. T1lg65 TaxID=2077101 RepID=UPI003F796A1F